MKAAVVVTDPVVAYVDLRKAVREFSGFYINFFNKRLGLESKYASIKSRKVWHVGIGPVHIPPNSTVNVATNLMIIFQGERLVSVGDSTDLYIKSLHVDSKNQKFAKQMPAPVSNYVQTSYIAMDLFTDLVNGSISFEIENTSSIHKTFVATLIGKAFY